MKVVEFEVKRAVCFDVEDFANEVLSFVTIDMWGSFPADEEDYNCLSEADKSTLINTILKTALEKYKTI